LIVDLKSGEATFPPFQNFDLTLHCCMKSSSESFLVSDSRTSIRANKKLVCCQLANEWANCDVLAQLNDTDCSWSFVVGNVQGTFSGFFLGIRMATSSTGTCPYANCPIISTERWALSRPSPIDYQFCILICPSRQCIEIELNKVTSSVSHCLFRPISVALSCRLFRSFAMAAATGGSPPFNVCDVSGLK